jgi:hypothetical protein
MKKLVVELLGTRLFKMVLKEWSLQVKAKQDPTMFANMYLEWMRDPIDHEARKAVTVFANFMRSREWSTVLRVIRPHLNKDVLEIFKSEEAGDFYDVFKAMVIEQIRAYWAEFIASRMKAKGEAEQGPRDWSPRASFCVCKKSPSKCRCKKPRP